MSGSEWDIKNPSKHLCVFGKNQTLRAELHHERVVFIILSFSSNARSGLELQAPEPRLSLQMGREEASVLV